MTDIEAEDNEPLDPQMERVRRKMVRLLIVSSSIMVIGLGAVFAGVLYRVSESEDGENQATTGALGQTGAAGAAKLTPMPDVALDIPVDEVAGIALDGGRVILTLDGPRPRIEIRRLADGALLQTLTLEPAAP